MKVQRLVMALAFGAASFGLFAQAPDNNAVNKQDRGAAATTADQAKNNRTDLDLAKDIRRSIVDDKSLSTYAHNIKVISQNGTVTLKGPVKSEDEKHSIMSKAISIAGGPDRVVDQMSVK